MKKNSTKIELSKELPIMLDYLDKLYYKTEDKEEKEELGIYHKNLSVLLEKAARTKFDKNNFFYKEVIESLKKTEQEIQKHLETQLKIVELFKYLTDFTEQLDALLFN